MSRHFCVTISYRTLSTRVLFWTEAIIPTSPLRISAGVCVLATGLLFGAGGAIASADETGSGASGGSTGTSQSSGTTTGAESSGTTSSVTTGSSTGTQPKLDRRFRLRIPDFSRLSPSRQGGGFNRPTTIFRGGVDRDAKKDATSEESKKDATTEETKATETVPGESEGTPGAEQQGAEAGVQTQTAEDQTAGTEESSTETGTGSEESVSTVPADGSGTQADSNSNSTSNSEAGSAASQTETTNVSVPPAPGPKPGPLTNAFVTINGAVVTWSQSLAALPTSKMPIIDAITSLQTMVTTVVGAVTRVPSDFYSMLGIPVSSGPPQSLIGGSGTLDVRKVNAPTGGPFVAPHAVEAPPYVVAPADGSLFGTMAPRPTPGKVTTSGTVQPLSVSGTVPLAPAAAPASARSIFEHVVEAVLVPASLTALAAIALPGVGALLVVAAAGVRVGYRQAKAGLALRASGIARFAGSGPLGVVRSGSIVALRQRARGPRTKRAVCPEAERAARSQEHVA